MIFGEYHHQLDEKNRMRMPAKLKAKLGERYVITKGSNKCLYVFPQSELESTINQKLNSIPLSDLNGQKFVRAIFSSAYEVEEDNQGRFLVPANLLKYAGITKNVVSIGSGNRVEIWDESSWMQYNADAQDFDDILSGLGQYGI